MDNTQANSRHLVDSDMQLTWMCSISGSFIGLCICLGCITSEVPEGSNAWTTSTVPSCHSKPPAADGSPSSNATSKRPPWTTHNLQVNSLVIHNFSALLLSSYCKTLPQCRRSVHQIFFSHNFQLFSNSFTTTLMPREETPWDGARHGGLFKNSNRCWHPRA